MKKYHFIWLSENGYMVFGIDIKAKSESEATEIFKKRFPSVSGWQILPR